MTHLERVKAVFDGETPDVIPVVPQSFMFCATSCGYSIGEINRSPQKMAECHARCREMYDYDGCIIDVDDATLAEACGAKVNWRNDNVASIDEHNPVLKDLRDVDSLHIPDPYRDGRLPEWLETTSRLRESVGKDVFIMGRADQGPFTLISLLRGTQNFMEDLIVEDEDVILHAVEWAVQAHVAFARAQLAAGADCTSMGDSYASPNLISPLLYRKYALPFESEVVKRVQTDKMLYSIHICGDTNSIISDMDSTGARLLEIDWKLDIRRARKIINDRTVLLGNVNPSDPLFLGSPEAVKKAAKDAIVSSGGKGLILSSGCAIGPNTPLENFKALVSSARLYGSREQLLELQEINK